MNEAKGRIVSLEQQNEKLTGDFSAAKERIVSLEGEVQRLSGLLLRQSAQMLLLLQLVVLMTTASR